MHVICRHALRLAPAVSLPRAMSANHPAHASNTSMRSILPVYG